MCMRKDVNCDMMRKRLDKFAEIRYFCSRNGRFERDWFHCFLPVGFVVTPRTSLAADAGESYLDQQLKGADHE